MFVPFWTPSEKQLEKDSLMNYNIHIEYNIGISVRKVEVAVEKQEDRTTTKWLLWTIVLGTVIALVAAWIWDANAPTIHGVDTSPGFFMCFFLCGLISYLLSAFIAAGIIHFDEDKIERRNWKLKKAAEFYIKCYVKGHTSFEDPISKERIALLAQTQNYCENADDQSLRNAFEASREAAIEYGRGFFTHVQQSLSKRNPSRREILDARRKPLDASLSDDELLSYFSIGEKAVITVDVIRAEEKAEREQLDEFVHLTGRDKRIAILTKEAEPLRKSLQESSHRLPDNYGQQKEHDWAVAGGIASAIGGGGAGVAAALDAQTRNADIRQRNAQMAQNVYTINSLLDQIQSNRESNYQYALKQIEETRLKLLGDDNDNQNLMSRLSVQLSGITVTETGAVRIEAEVCLNSDEQVRIRQGQIQATIDGVIIARLMQNGVFKGKAYLTLPRLGVCSQTPTKVKGICTSTNDPSAQYQVEFEPHQLWTIEI